jgi:hypothetical protein
MNRIAPPPPDAHLKFWFGVATVCATAVTAVVTYTITLTLAFTSVQKDLALLNQKIDLQLHALEARVSILEARTDALQALVNQVKTAQRGQP